MAKNDKKMAKVVVDYIGDAMFDVHRGAIWWTRTVIAIFGNDGYEQGGWVKEEVATLRRRLADQGISEAGFAVADDGYSWVVLIKAPSPLSKTPRRDFFDGQPRSRRFAKLVWEVYFEQIQAAATKYVHLSAAKTAA